MLTDAKASLPKGFNEKVLEGLDPVEQIEFIDRFKAAMPVVEEKTKPAKAGATVPGKPTQSDEGQVPGSMAERSKQAREQILANRKAGQPGIVSGFYH